MIIIEYFLWHYLQAPKRILQIWGNFLQFFLFYFIPIPQLLKTILAPWKKDVSGYGAGFELKKFIQTFAFNMISRAIGAVIKFFTIIFAVALLGLALIGGAAFLVLWIFWPFFLAASLVSGIFFIWQTPGAKIKTFIFLIINLATIFIFGLLYQMSRQKLPSEMSLKEVFRQKWPSIIWERLGLKQEEIPEEILSGPEELLGQFLKEKGIEQEDFKKVTQWYLLEENEKLKKRRFWEKENLFKIGGFGRSWLYGWTPNLDKFAREIREIPGSINLIGRKEEIGAMERILCKSQQGNVLLVGEPGVGKETLINQFAKLIKEGKVAAPLAYRRVLELDLNLALSGLTTEGDIKQRLMKIFNEAQYAGNIILVINNIHNFVSSLSPEQKDVSQILIPYLDGSYFQLIATTTYKDLHNYIQKNQGLLTLFEKVEIKEPDSAQALLILQDVVDEMEKKKERRVTLQALKEVIKTSDRYIADSPMPEKAIDLLEEAIIYAAVNAKGYFVLPEHIDAVVSQKAEMPVGELQKTEKEKLANLEEFIHQRVVDQELAVKNIASAMRRARLGIGATNRPMGSFLFMGPTGVGKTETAKALAEAYFGAENRMIRFDMSEFQDATAVERAIGSATSQKPGLLTTAVRENQFSLLLLDEIEKSDPEILNLFLQVLDEGWLTDAFGQKINFRNLIIIATSNAAAELIREMVQQNVDLDASKQKIFDYVHQKGIFKPEFLNRFDGVVIFKPLSQDDILKVASLLLKGLAKRLAGQDLIFNFNDDLVQKVASLGYDPTNGARAMRRLIQDKIEDLIAKKMLKGEIQKKTPFEIKAEEIQ
ncbi:MAG: AAA family ATPase [Candidatus Portnoybacteria bacterium]|nr:AAA family ATPase [Candidatus Portnoybacteria bacterium]